MPEPQRTRESAWEVLGIKRDGCHVVLSRHATEAEAKQQRLLFLSGGVEGYEGLTVRPRQESSIAMGNVLKLSEAAERTPPVNPVEALRQNLQMALFGALTGSDVTQVVEKLKEQALAGDLKATRLLLDLIAGGGPAAVQAVIVGGGGRERPARKVPHS